MAGNRYPCRLLGFFENVPSPLFCFSLMSYGKKLLILAYLFIGRAVLSQLYEAPAGNSISVSSKTAK
jgi:hypothetical protein